MHYCETKKAVARLNVFYVALIVAIFFKKVKNWLEFLTNYFNLPEKNIVLARPENIEKKIFYI